MVEMVSSIAVLAVVVLGLLIMVQAISPGDALRFAGRALVRLLFAVLALAAVRTLWTCFLVPWFSAGLASFKASLFWIAITLVALIALLLALRLVFKQLGRQFTLRLGSQKGDRYDNDHF